MSADSGRSQGDAAARNAETDLVVPVEDPTVELAAPVVPGQLRAGDLFAGRYRIELHLGKGGFAHVFAATDTASGERVALKFLTVATSNGLVRRMERELRLARDLRHPNIVRVFELVERHGFHCLVMELVDGFDLKELIQREPMELDRAVTILSGLTSALAAVHAAGIVHRDLKPHNVMITGDDTVKLLDFGLAKTPESTGLTVSGTILGTPDYMSPEQIEGQTADARSDVYSLGVLAWELLTGRPPFRGDRPIAVAMQHLRSRVRDPRELRPDVPPALAELILRMTAPQPSQRPQSADAVLLDMERITETSQEPRPGRRRHLRWLAAAASLALAAGAAGTMVLRSQPPPQTGGIFDDGQVAVVLQTSTPPAITGGKLFLEALAGAIQAKLVHPAVEVRTDVPQRVARRQLANLGVEELLQLSVVATEGGYQVSAEVSRTSEAPAAPRTLHESSLEVLDFAAVEEVSAEQANAYLADVEAALRDTQAE